MTKTGTTITSTFKTAMKSICPALLFFITTFSYANSEHHYNHEHDYEKDSKIMLHMPSVKTTPPGIQNSVGYFHLMNQGKKDLQLIGANSDIAERIEVHKHTLKNGLMKMQKVDSITVPAGSSLEFKPGGYHIMFMGVKKPLTEGDEVSFTLEFAGGDNVVVKAKAKKTITSKEGRDQHNHH